MKRVVQAARSLFLDNIGAKFLAVICAVALWSLARSETKREVQFDVPLVVSYPRDRVLLEHPPTSLQVRVEGHIQDLTQVLARQARYELDLSAYEDGQRAYFTGDALGRFLGGRLKVLTVSPSNFEVKFDRMEERRVPVDVDIGKEPGPFVAVVREKIEVEPRFVLVTGPSSRLEGIRTVRTESLDLSSFSSDFTGKLALEAREGVKFNPASVRVTIPLKEKEGSRIISAGPMAVRDCPEGFQCEVSPSLYQVRVQGRERVLAGITADSISEYVYIDGSRLSIPSELLEKRIPAVAPTIDPLKEATISLLKTRYFNIKVVRRQPTPDEG